MTPRAQKTLFVSVAVLAGLALAVVALQPNDDGTPPGENAPSDSASAASESAPSSARPAPFDRTHAREQFVGSAACASCHAAQANAYATSHHALALVPTKADDFEAQLAHASFSSPLGGTTRFAEKGGKVEVTSPDASGRPGTLPVAYTSGVWPLEQYVVPTERGKLQSLGVVWDSRAKGEGGERWFHVYGGRGIAPGDQLFFTRPAQNWNHVCADCHSTFVERRYDAEKDAFDTRWAELSVGCEACHGPGAEHVRLAKAGTQGAAWGGAKGLVVGLKAAPPWTPSPSGSPVGRSPDTVEIEVCAPCHSRREPLHEGFVAGDPLLDAFEPELLAPGRYHADGQVEGEVYEWGSFLQSKMHAMGVRCSDCHEPHAAKLRAPDNALCLRCHSTARFEQESHTHHAGAKAPRCMDCHMPPATFMQIDERRDHSIRIPRPDLSVEFGVPNACNLCHTRESAAWARDAVAGWFPGLSSRAHFANALLRDRKGAFDAPRALATLAGDATAPSIARATALERLGTYRTKRALDALRAALASNEPLVVYGAVLGASNVPPAERVNLLFPLVSHRIRAVRIVAAKALAGVPLSELGGEKRAAVERAFTEVMESFAVSASRPETHVERSAFLLASGNVAEAEKALRTALRLAPCLAEAHLNLADLARSKNDEKTAEAEIRAALKCDPNHPAAHHALGLWAVRTKDSKTALASLRKAVELAPSDARFAYVLAVAVSDTDASSALGVLDAGLEHHPNDLELLQARLMIAAKAGKVELASEAKQAIDKIRE